MEPVRVAFLVFPGITQLDFTGPAQILSKLGKVTIDSVAKTREPIATDSGFSIVPTATLDKCREADLLCVPGGVGVHDVMDDEAQLAWVREVGGSARFVTSVCTGSLILGGAGLLKGYKGTCHWMWRDYLSLFGAIPTEARVVTDRNRITGGGVTAGIDFGLSVIAALRGEEHARLAQLAVEYDPEPPFDSGSPAAAGPERVARIEALSAQEVEWRSARIRAAAERLRGS
ncbi:MAG TPA: DJ-1/PfpI family protein [Allosphingosinicella sp.]|jgi:cyclohexyl-isocyanide hydratase